ncbi:MAG: SpoIIE family protein phosphatase [Treponema sp.]|jgi:serine phosphatase RsbU (regulator of sigma subunit)|nr:SpoIIE family protein phosphatase [Treponema sp.]
MMKLTYPPFSRFLFPGALAVFLVLFALSPLGALSDFYWESPELFSASPGNFPVSAFNGDFSVLAWQQSGPALPEGGDGSIRIHLVMKESGGPWRDRGIVGGPYTYSGAEPSILSLIIDGRGRILIAAAASSSETEILISEDRGESFRRYRVDSGTESSLAPRIAAASDGEYLLFVTRGHENSLSIYYARSRDGTSWSPFEPFITAPELQLNFLPAHGGLKDRDYVFFQSFVGGGEDAIPAFQLYSTISLDGGRTWTPPRRFTDFADPRLNSGASPDRYDNQRPFLSVQGDALYVVWERRFSTGSPQIYFSAVAGDGSAQGEIEQVNNEDAYCNNPILFQYEEQPTVVWFDNRRGDDRIFLAQKAGIDWPNYDLSGTLTGDASFGRPVVDAAGLCLFWQTTAGGVTRIYALEPDTTVAPPRIIPGNFTPGRRNRTERVRFSWNVPNDSSGISGFSWMWSRDENAEPPRQIMAYNTRAAASTGVEERAPEDGIWYFSLIAQDYAGNWSRPARLEYIRDTTPPPAAVIIPPELDEQGYLLSNSFSIEWNPPPASDIAGYTWLLQYLGSAEPFDGFDNHRFLAAAEGGFGPGRITAPRIQTTGTSLAWDNQDDGVWSFSVSAVDEVGNVGPLSTIFFRTNKYVPRTFITWVDSRQDEQGILYLRIYGRGFTQGGALTRIFLDRDGEAPYDREFRLGRQDFVLVSDREIGGFRVEDLERGNYRIGMEHPLRGFTMTGPLVAVGETGTVKFGNYGLKWNPSWMIRELRRFVFDTNYIIIAAILVFCALGILVSIRGIGSVIAEGAVIRLDAAALITGDFMPSEKKKRLAGIKRRGGGLRLKLASFTIVLVLLVVVMISAPLYIIMTRTQQETLLRGLWDRSTVLLDGMATNARSFLPSGDVLNLGYLPAQSAAIPEARYITITGYGTGDTIYNDHVWATNDPDILNKIDTEEFRPGVSRLADSLSERLEGLGSELDDGARKAVGELSASIAGLTQEGISIANRQDQASRNRLQDIQVTTRTLETRLTEELAAIGRVVGSEPEFSVENFDPRGSREYIFFKPIMFRQGTEDTYYRGLIRLDVSIDSILDEIARGQKGLLWVILMVALAALVIGIIGALTLSNIIIRPLRKLVSHVEQIRDTEDKADLEGVDITIKSRDEIAVLGNTINDMTHGLVKAAQAASDLSIGKEVQKKFIPLELDREGNKLSSGYKDTKNAHFFGYYEGAKGVSGDYFDYQDLDGRYYAIIKCDVAGKGIPAALIMIQVATMFLTHFKQWKPTEKGMHIEDLVYQINDFIETLAFKGRFAAFTLCLFDSQTGLVRFCNAGDNIVHLYDASEGRMKTLTLPETPATGVLPNFLVESKGGYKVQTVTIDHGDILLLYTDGIEEAKRKFRDEHFNEILCTEGGAPNDTPHENHVVGQGDEEMGPDRVTAIINAVMNRGVYTLHKWHNPEGENTDLTFDFTTCDGKVEEVIMSMVSVEKMFRGYRNPAFTDENRVLVDKKIDGYLKTHFLQYRTYCSYTRENPGNDAYMYYTRLKEDDQYDDLTILGIKRK